MKVRLTSEGKRVADTRVALMLERYVRDQRGAAPIVLRQPELRPLLATSRA